MIEEQKREIARLIRENAELKKHVEASGYSPEKVQKSPPRIAPAHPPHHSMQFADSGASEDSYDSISSLHEVGHLRGQAEKC